MGRGTRRTTVHGAANSRVWLKSLTLSPSQGSKLCSQVRIDCGLPWWLSWLRIHLQCGRPGFNPWVGKICWRRERLPTPASWPGEFHGLYSPGSYKESDKSEWLSLSFFQGSKLSLFTSQNRLGYIYMVNNSKPKQATEKKKKELQRNGIFLSVNRRCHSRLWLKSPNKSQWALRKLRVQKHRIWLRLLRCMSKEWFQWAHTLTSSHT